MVPVVACTDGSGGGFVDGCALSEGIGESSVLLIADVADLALMSAEFVKCSYSGRYACGDIGRLLVHSPRTACTYFKKPSAQLRAGRWGGHSHLGLRVALMPLDLICGAGRG